MFCTESGGGRTRLFPHQLNLQPDTGNYSHHFHPDSRSYRKQLPTKIPASSSEPILRPNGHHPVSAPLKSCNTASSCVSRGVLEAVNGSGGSAPDKNRDSKSEPDGLEEWHFKRSPGDSSQSLRYFTFAPTKHYPPRESGSCRGTLRRGFIFARSLQFLANSLICLRSVFIANFMWILPSRIY